MLNNSTYSKQIFNIKEIIKTSIISIDLDQQTLRMSVPNIIADSFFILILLFLAIQASKAPLIAHQYKLMVGVSPLDVTVSFPSNYSAASYPRFLVLAGYSIQTDQEIDFQMYLQSVGSSTSQVISFIPGGSAVFNFVSVYVVMYSASAGWINAFNISQTYVNISSYNIMGEINQTYVRPGCSIGLVSNHFAFLTYFHAESQADAEISIKVQSSISCFPFASINVTTSRIHPENQIVLSAGIVVVLIHVNNQLYAGGTPYYFNTLNFVSDTTPVNLLTQASTNFNINESFSNSTFGGFDGNCLMGLSMIGVAGNTSGIFGRSFAFNATTDPISDIENTLPKIDSWGFYQKFYSTLNIACLDGVPCSNISFYVPFNYSCEACSLVNCTECIRYSECLHCTVGSGITMFNGGQIGSYNGIAFYPGKCQYCQSLSPYCLECIQHNICTKCINDQYYVDLAFNAADPYYGCFQCAYPFMNNCLTCTNSTYCTQCDNNTYYLSLQNRFCLSCWASIENCVTCSVNVTLKEYNCTACIPSMFANLSHECQPCSHAIYNCLNCNNNPNYCSECLTTSLGYNPLNNSCVPCDTLYPNCIHCLNQGCYECLPGFLLASGQCFCIKGKFQNGVCSTIQGCTNIIQYSDGTQGCSSCDQNRFHQQPINGVCICLKGTLINSQCSTIVGCITPITPLNQPQYCLFCNQTAGFTAVPLNGVCRCPLKYQIQGEKCRDICGDGFVMINKSEVCDDGNLVNGDGCSSLCRIQIGYQCFNGSSTLPSDCVYVGIPLKLSLQLIERVENLNEGLFKFNISPPLLSLNKMNYSQKISFVCQSTQYIIKSISYASGILTIIADYSTDMEGRSCTLTLNYDRKLIHSFISNSTALSFEAISRNIPLNISNQLQMLATLKYIFDVLSYITLGLFFLSLIHKMIGVQLIFCCQIVYLSNCLYKVPSFLISAIKQFQLVTGDWALFYQASDSQALFSFAKRVNLTFSFLQDSLIVVSVLIMTSIVWFTLFFFNQMRQKQQQTPYQLQYKTKTATELVATVINQMLLFPIAMGFFCVLSIAEHINNLRLQENKSSIFSVHLSILSQLFTWLIVGTVAGRQYLIVMKKRNYLKINIQKFDKGCQGLKKGYHLYVPLYILKIAITTILIEMGVSLTFSLLIYPIFLLSLISIVLIIKVCPYQKAIDNFGLICMQLTASYSIFLAVLENFIQIKELTQLMLLFLLQGFLIISLISTFARILRVLWLKILKLCYSQQKVAQMIDIKQSSQKQIKSSKKRLEQIQMQSMVSQVYFEQKKRINPYRLTNERDASKHKNITRRLPNPLPNEIISKNIQMKESSRQSDDQELKNIKQLLKENLIQKKALIAKNKK